MESLNLLHHIRNGDENVLIWLFNIGVEKYWNKVDNIVKNEKEDIVVNHIEEINLLITRKQDYVIMRKRPAESFLKSLQENGYEVPNIICPSIQDEQKCISELVLMDEGLKEELTQISKQKNVFFVPYGVSNLEEQIALSCGIKLIGGTDEKSKKINNKIFSKEVARKLNLPAADEFVCCSIEEIRQAYSKLIEKYNQIVVKMPCNSSGQGMWVIDNEKKLNATCMIVNRMMTQKGITEWLVEGWIEKQIDLNLQVYVSEKGEVETFSVKEQIIDGTLYIGSVIPARISEQQYRECVDYGNRIGEYLYSLGHSGIFGIDALVARDGTIIPIIEINGRFTLSTYISFLDIKYPGKVIYSFYERFHGVKKFDYDLIMERLKSENIWINKDKGVYIYNSATTDAKFAMGNIRFFCMIVGEDLDEIYLVKERIINIINEYVIGE